MQKKEKKTGHPASQSFELEKYPFFLMAQAWSTYSDVMSSVLKSIDMDPPRWRVLMILGDSSPCSVSGIADKAVMKLPTITRIVQRMQEEDLVRCAPRAQDNRVTEVFLTGQGRDALRQVKKVAGNIFERAFDGLENTEINQLNSVLRHIQKNLIRSPYE